MCLVEMALVCKSILGEDTLRNDCFLRSWCTFLFTTNFPGKTMWPVNLGHFFHSPMSSACSQGSDSHMSTFHFVLDKLYLQNQTTLKNRKNTFLFASLDEAFLTCNTC